MTDDLPDRFPNGPLDTNPMLEEILATVRELRGLPAAVDEVNARIGRLEAKLDDLRGELSGTRRIYREELNLEVGNLTERLESFDRRIRALEGRQPTP